MNITISFFSGNKSVKMTGVKELPSVGGFLCYETERDGKRLVSKIPAGQVLMIEEEHEEENGKKK